MRFRLEEISLSNLRSFIDYSDKYCHTRLSGFSLVSIRTRIQLIISEQKFTDFDSFFLHFKENDAFRNSTINSFYSHSNELFRDADSWLEFSNELKQKNNTLSIVIFESGNYSDLITLIICLKLFNINASITIVDFLSRNKISSSCIFDKREFEIGKLNYQQAKFDLDFESFFKVKNQMYEFELPEEIELNYINKNDLNTEIGSFDVLIARNITLNYNHSLHQEIFNLYLNIVRSGGVLFLGNKESFKWCTDFSSLVIKSKSSSIHYKKL